MKIFIGKEANDFLKKYNLNVAFYEIAKDFDEAEKKLGAFSFPMVLKLISKDALHKTEFGGVKVVWAKESFEKTFEALLETAKKNKIKVDDILLQEFVEGLELIVGLKKDPTFGHVIMLGLGGIYVEAIRDVTFRVCPINDADASEMIHDLRGKGLILSERRKLDVERLKKVLVRLSKLPQKKKDIVELDINPLILNGEEARTVDVRIVFD